jgi:quercetin 2,3-dioxygenase
LCYVLQLKFVYCKYNLKRSCQYDDEILSYIWTGVTHHKDSAGFEAPIARGKLMMMNAGESFWHEEKVKEDAVEMLQIFVRPNETNLPPKIQFHDKPVDNHDWYVMVA